MATQWYYQGEGQQKGPVSPSDLKRLAEEGRIQRSTLVFKASLDHWVPARKVKELFSAQGRLPTPSRQRPDTRGAVPPIRRSTTSAASPGQPSERGLPAEPPQRSANPDHNLHAPPPRAKEPRSFLVSNYGVAIGGAILVVGALFLAQVIRANDGSVDLSRDGPSREGPSREGPSREGPSRETGKRPDLSDLGAFTDGIRATQEVPIAASEVRTHVSERGRTANPRRTFRTPRPDPESVKRAAVKILVATGAHAVAKSEDGNDGFFAALSSVGARAARDTLVENALQDVFPELNDFQIRGVRRVISLYLDDELSFERIRTETAKEEIMIALQEQDPALGASAQLVDFIYQLHRASSKY